MAYLILFVIIGIAPLMYIIYKWTKEEYEKDRYQDEY